MLGTKFARPRARSGSQFWRSVAVIATGSVIGQMIGIVTLPIISRLYPPAAFGQYALLTSASAFLTVVVMIGLSSAIMAPETDDMAERVVVVILACAVALTLILVGLLVGIASIVSLPLSGMPPWEAGAWLFAMTVVNALLSLTRTYTNRRGKNRALAYNAVLSAASSLCIAVPLGFVDESGVGLILASLVAGLASSLQMMRHANPFRHRLNLATVRSVLQTYRSYVTYQYPANLMESAGAQLPTQALGALYGSAQLGSYSMNERLMGVPMRLIGAPLSIVYFRDISEGFRSGRNLAPRAFSVVSKVLLAAVVPMLMLIFLGPDLFAWALGRQWEEAGELCAYLVPMYVLSLCRTSVSNTRVAIGRHRINAWLSAVRLLIVVGALAWGHAWFGTITGTIFVLSIASSLFMIVDMATNFALMGGYLKRYLLLMLAFGGSTAVAWQLAGYLSIIT